MFDPPSQPAAGWYPDPHRPGTSRWWNGRDWEAAWDDGFQVGRAEPDAFPDVGEWLNASFRAGLSRWRATLLIGLFAGALSTVLIGLAARHLLADVVITEDEVSGWSNDRLPIGLVLVAVAVFLSALGQLAVTILMLRTVDGETATTTENEIRRGWSATLQSLRVLPRFLGWTALLVLGFVGAALVVAGLFVVVLPLGVIALLVLIPAAIYLAVRLAFVSQSIVDRPGQPFGRSFEVSRNRAWAVVGRLLLLGLLMWVISVVFQVVTGLASGDLGSGFGQSGLEFEDDGTFTRFEMADAFPTSAVSITVGALAAAGTTVATGIAGAAFAILYRTRNPAGEAFVAATRRER